MVYVINKIRVCVDCLLYLTNGELTDGDGNDIAEAHGRKIAALWEGENVILAPCGDEESDDAFSDTNCEGCGSNLAGSRHDVAVMLNGTDGAMKEALARGINRGYDAANFADAYGDRPGSVTGQAESVATELYLRGQEEFHMFVSGYLEGWRRFNASEWPDGTSRSDSE